jgi:UDP:flavonoid glycosyltransferase YjiC (YdhE family)
MLVTNFREQLPERLPAGVQAFGYVPFSDALPRAAALVYHGGIGTLAQGIKAGIPHLAVPNAHDQFDNAWRIEQLGLGRGIAERRYRAAGAAAALEGLLDDASLRKRCGFYAARLDADAALRRACELIEALAPL